VKYGTNTLYVIDIKVPPKIYTCEVPVGITCELTKITTSNNGSATPQTSGVVNVYTGWAGTTIIGVKQGYTDVFVYES